MKHFNKAIENSPFLGGDQRELIAINTAVQQFVVAANADAAGDDNHPVWQRLYEAVFSKQISQRVFQLTALDYYDPDTTYREDALAFANALKERFG